MVEFNPNVLVRDAITIVTAVTVVTTKCHLSRQINHANSPPKNIARIAKRCSENITSVFKCVKFLFPKGVRKKKK